jgi:hypothetical protein
MIGKIAFEQGSLASPGRISSAPYEIEARIDVALDNVKHVTVKHQKALNCISQEDRLPPNHLTPDACALNARFRRATEPR